MKQQIQMTDLNDSSDQLYPIIRLFSSSQLKLLHEIQSHLLFDAQQLGGKKKKLLRFHLILLYAISRQMCIETWGGLGGRAQITGASGEYSLLVQLASTFGKYSELERLS